MRARASASTRQPKPRFFRDAAAFRSWLDKNHAVATELWTGYYKKGSGKASVTYAEALDEALCYGWIDGIVRTIDAERYMQRWTPRKEKSTWSKVNVAKVEALIAAGRMTPAGLAAYARRTTEQTGYYSFENRNLSLDAAALKTFKSNAKAWTFFQAQAPYYRRLCTHYVTSAKRPETREKRLAAVILHSSRGERIPQFLPSKPRVSRNQRG